MKPASFKPNYLRTSDGTRDRWMVSYMDVLTILLIFFIAAATQSLRLSPKPADQQVVSTPPRPLAHILEKIEELGLDAKLEPQGLVISLPQTIFFSSGEDRISEDVRPVIAQIAGILNQLPNRVSLVGHADAVPIHNRRFRNNWELASARGLRLLEILSNEYGIAESRLSVASYSSFDPKNSNDTSDGRASNRRVEIVILDGVNDH